MIHRTSIIILFVLLYCAACFGQSTFMGLTPGKSTRAEAERVLGQPVQRFSATLIEYKPQQEADKIYVQYADGSPDAIVDRIEATCTHDGWGMNTPNSLRCERWQNAIQGKYRVDLSKPDAFNKNDNPVKSTYYFGSPRFIVNSTKYCQALYNRPKAGVFIPASYLRTQRQNAVAPERSSETGIQT